MKVDMKNVGQRMIQLTQCECWLLGKRREVNRALSDIRRRRLALVEGIEANKDAPVCGGGEVAEVEGASTRRSIRKSTGGVKPKRLAANAKQACRKLAQKWRKEARR